MLPELLEAAAAMEARLAAAAPPRVDVLKGAFDAQRAFVLDPAPFKASFCTRRAAKSFSVGLEFINDSFDYPGAAYLFLATVRAQAKRDFWNDVLKAIDQQYALGMTFNESDLIARMPNGARFYVGGADASATEWRKMVGGKYRKVHIDEAQGFVHMPLETLVYETFKPAVADYRGTIGLSGTPGMLAKGLFFNVVRGAESGWSVHKWKTADNPYMRDKIAAEIAELKLLKPGIEQTPFFRRNYLAEWVIEDASLVYRYVHGRNDFDKLPEHRAGDWHYVLGCDLGYTDATSFVVAAYHDFDPTLYVLEASKEAGMDVTAVATRAKALMRKYDFDALVIDNANKQAVEEMVKRHEIPWKPADKTGKADFIEVMNGEFIMGRVKLGPEAQALKDEYSALIWDDKSAKKQEHPACENHCADGGLYAWRYTYQYLSTAPRVPPKPGTPEYAQEQEEQMEAAAVAAYEREQHADDDFYGQ